MPDGEEREPGRVPASADTAAAKEAAVALSAERLRLRPDVEPFDASVLQGEILGLAGLEGHGQELFLKTLAGLVRAPAGTVHAYRPNGACTEVTSAKVASHHGVSYVPRDRKTEGLFADLSVLDNFAIASLNRASVAGILRRRALIDRYERARTRLQIASRSPRQSITALSGGTQQKVLLARALEMGSRVLLLNDPTRGVDVGTKRGLHEIFRELARDDHVSVVILSTELTELVQLCDRVLVFYGGTLAGAYTGELTEDALLSAMFGRSAAASDRPNPRQEGRAE